MGSEGRGVRTGEGQRGWGFAIIFFLSTVKIFTLSLPQLEMNLKISRDEYCHSHSKNSHGLETQIYIFVLCLVSSSVSLPIISHASLLISSVVLKMFLMFDLTRQSLHEPFWYSYACLDKLYSSIIVYVYQAADLPNSFQPCWKKKSHILTR